MREYRDQQGRTYSQYVADQVMGVITASGKSLREVAIDSGINRTTLRERLHDERPFNTRELASIATALDVHPTRFAEGFTIAD